MSVLSPRLAAIFDALPISEGMRVLEIGGAPGAAAKAVAGRIGEGHILMIDRSAKGIALTKQKRGRRDRGRTPQRPSDRRRGLRASPGRGAIRPGIRRSGRRARWAPSASRRDRKTAHRCRAHTRRATVYRRRQPAARDRTPTTPPPLTRWKLWQLSTLPRGVGRARWVRSPLNPADCR